MFNVDDGCFAGVFDCWIGVDCSIGVGLPAEPVD